MNYFWRFNCLWLLFCWVKGKVKILDWQGFNHFFCKKFIRFFAMLYTHLNINHLREIKKIKQFELADAIGVQRNTISNYEKQRSKPDHNILVKIADYFGIKVEMLMRENLSERFVTWDEFQNWREAESKETALAERLQMEVSVAPIKIDALVEHYAKAMSQLTSKTEGTIMGEIEAIFARRLAEASE